MRMKIFSAVLLGAALALAGCSGDGGSSTSTSGSGGSTASSNGGSTNGSTGNTTTQSSNGGSSGASNGGSSGGTNGGGACSATNPSGTCTSPAETCQRFTVTVDGGSGPRAGGHVNQCACSATQTSDSCSVNTDGNTVCDLTSGHCRKPQLYDPANLYPDGGDIGTEDACDFDNNYGPVRFCVDRSCTSTELLCAQFCTANAECTAMATSCDLGNPLYYVYPDAGEALYPDGGFPAFDDGGFDQTFLAGDTAVAICQPAPCGSDYADDAGNPINGDYFDTCTVKTANDGFCSGEGICVQSDAAAQFESSCNVDLFNAPLTSGGCAAGMQCSFGPNLGLGDLPGDNGFCTYLCNATPPGDGGIYDVNCPSVGGTAFQCGTFQGVTAGANGQVTFGECFP